MSPRRTLVCASTGVLLALCVGCGGSGTEPTNGTAPGEAAADALSATTEEGPVKATVEVRPAKPRLGDSLTLTLTVESAPDVVVEMPAFGEALGRFSIVDFTPRETTEPDGRSVASQRYTLQAPMSGKQRIPPLRIEYLDRRAGQAAVDDTEDYRELLTDELSVTIASVLPEGAVAEELRPVRPSLAERGGPRPWIVGLSVLVGLAAIAWLVSYVRQRTRERARITAYDKAMRRIAALERRGLPSSGDADAWYVELSDIVRRYLEDRYGVRAPELTTEEFLQEARRSAELTPAHRALLSSFLEQCDRVKFAAYHPEQSESKAALATSRRFLDETRIVAETVEDADKSAA